MKITDATETFRQPVAASQPLTIYIDRERVDNKAIETAIVDDLAWRIAAPNRVTAIRIGGCIEAIGTDRQGAMRRGGHAHTGAKDPHRGAICIKSGKIEKVVTANGNPTLLLAHEFAHIAVMAGHTARWRAAMVALGFPSEARLYERAA